MENDRTRRAIVQRIKNDSSVGSMLTIRIFDYI